MICQPVKGDHHIYTGLKNVIYSFFKQVHTPGKSQNLNIFGQGGPSI